MNVHHLSDISFHCPLIWKVSSGLPSSKSGHVLVFPLLASVSSSLVMTFADCKGDLLLKFHVSDALRVIVFVSCVLSFWFNFYVIESTYQLHIFGFSFRFVILACINQSV